MTDSWVPVPAGSGFPVAHLPYAVARRAAHDRPRPVTRVGDTAVDLSGLAAAGLLPGDGWFARPDLGAFLAAGPAAWAAVRARLTELLTDATHRGAVSPALVPVSSLSLVLPFEVADYVDFYSSIDHATNVGRLFRPDGEPLPPNWRHLPVGYHGRAGTVVVSGTPIVRPCGQRSGVSGPVFGPTERLDIEAEVGFVVGVPSPPGEPVPVGAFADHVFGVALVNDWSARDIQSWESRPLGPFLGKSFGTSLAGWVTPLAALEAARVPVPPHDPAPLPYLVEPEPWGLDLALEVEIAGTVVARPPFARMWWSPAQQLAHLTVNGAHLRTGDLYASGTVSGPERDQRGCLLELTWGGAEPLALADGSTRAFLQDGDEVVIRATAPAVGGGRLALGEVRGRVAPARG